MWIVSINRQVHMPFLTYESALDFAAELEQEGIYTMLFYDKEYSNGYI